MRESRVGQYNSRFPGGVILLSVLVTLLSSLGLLTFREEAEMTALWVPEGSKFREDFEWVGEHFPKQLRSVTGTERLSNISFIIIFPG